MKFFSKLVVGWRFSSVQKNISITFFRQIIAAITQLLVVVLIARELGPVGNGFYSMAVLLPTMISSFLNLGLSPATVYYTGRKDFPINLVVKENIKLAFWVSLSGLIIIVPVLIFWGEYLFPNIPDKLLYIALTAFPLLVFLSFISSIIQGLEDFKAFNVSILTPPVVTLIGTLLSLFVFSFGITGILVAFVLGQLMALIIVLFYIKRFINSSYSMGLNKDKERKAYRSKVLNYGWKAHLSNIITFINYRTDVYLVNFFISPAATGLYMIAVQIAEKLWMPSQAVSTVLLPKLSSMVDNPKKRLELTKKGFWLVALITSFFSLAVAVILYYFIGPIFGDEYRDALPALICLMPGIVLWAGARVQANCIAAAGKPEWNFYISLGVLLINVVGNILLIPVMGILGAAVSTTTAYIFDALAKAAIVRRTVNLK